MFTFALCCLVILFFLVTGEFLRSKNILKGESLRKFVHISAGCFIAFLPWMMSWRQIQLFATALLAGVIANRYLKLFHFSMKIGRREFGDIFFALSIFLCASLTTSKLIFALAMLQLAIADGAAALVGKKYGQNWQYKVLHQTKTVAGSLTFMVFSAYILTLGIYLGANGQIDYQSYVAIVAVLPVALTLVESVSIFGLDDITVPIVALLALRLAQVA